MKAFGKIRTGQKNKNSVPNNPKSPKPPTCFKAKALPMLIIAVALLLFIAPTVNAANTLVEGCAAYTDYGEEKLYCNLGDFGGSLETARYDNRQPRSGQPLGIEPPVINIDSRNDDSITVSFSIEMDRVDRKEIRKANNPQENAVRVPDFPPKLALAYCGPKTDDAGSKYYQLIARQNPSSDASPCSDENKFPYQGMQAAGPRSLLNELVAFAGSIPGMALNVIGGFSRSPADTVKTDSDDGDQTTGNDITRLDCTFRHASESIVPGKKSFFDINLRPDGKGSTTISPRYTLSLAADTRSLQITGTVVCAGGGRYEQEVVYRDTLPVRNGASLTYDLKCDADIKSSDNTQKLKCSIENVKLENPAKEKTTAEAEKTTYVLQITTNNYNLPNNKFQIPDNNLKKTQEGAYAKYTFDLSSIKPATVQYKRIVTKKTTTKYPRKMLEPVPGSRQLTIQRALGFKTRADKIYVFIDNGIGNPFKSTISNTFGVDSYDEGLFLLSDKPFEDMGETDGGDSGDAGPSDLVASIGETPIGGGNNNILYCTFKHDPNSIVPDASEAKFDINLRPDGTGSKTTGQGHMLALGVKKPTLQISGKVACKDKNKVQYEAQAYYSASTTPKDGVVLVYDLKCDANIKSKGSSLLSSGGEEVPKLKCTFENVKLEKAEAAPATPQAAQAGSNEITFDVTNGFTITGVDEERGCTASKDEKAKTVKLSCTKPIIATVLYTGVGFKIKNEAKAPITIWQSQAQNAQCFTLDLGAKPIAGTEKTTGEQSFAMLSRLSEDCLNPKTTELGFEPKRMMARISTRSVGQGLLQELPFEKLEIELVPEYADSADEYAIVTSPGDNAEVMVRGLEGSTFEEPTVVINNMQLRAKFALPEGLEKAERHKTYGSGSGNDYLFGTIKLTPETNAEIRLTGLGSTILTLGDDEYGVAKIKTHQSIGLGTAYENNGAITSGEQLSEGRSYNVKKTSENEIKRVSERLQRIYAKYFGKVDALALEKLAWPLPVFMPVREAGEKGGIKLYEFQYQRDGNVKAAEYKEKGLGSGLPYAKYDAGTKTYKIQNWPNGKDELNLFNINKRGLAFDGNEKVFAKLAEAFESTKVPSEIEGMDLGEKDAVKVKPVFLRLEADGKGGALLKHKAGPGDTDKPAPDFESGDNNIETKIKALEKEIAESGNVWEGIDATKKITESKSAAPAEKKASKLKKGELAVDLEYVADEKGSAGKLYVYLVDLKSAQTGAKTEKPEGRPKPPQKRKQAVAEPASEISFAGTEGDGKGNDYAEMKKNFAVLDDTAAKMVEKYIYSGTKAPDGVVLRGDSKNTLNVKIPAPEKVENEVTAKCELTGLKIEAEGAEKVPSYDKKYPFEGPLDKGGNGKVEKRDAFKGVKFYFNYKNVNDPVQLKATAKVSCTLKGKPEKRMVATGAKETKAEGTAEYANGAYKPIPSGDTLACGVECDFKENKIADGKCKLDCSTGEGSIKGDEALDKCITTELFGPDWQKGTAKVKELTAATGIRYRVGISPDCKKQLPAATTLFESVEVALENEDGALSTKITGGPWFMAAGEWIASFGKLGVDVEPTYQMSGAYQYLLTLGGKQASVKSAAPGNTLKVTVKANVKGSSIPKVDTVGIIVGTAAKTEGKPAEKKADKTPEPVPEGMEVVSDSTVAYVDVTADATVLSIIKRKNVPLSKPKTKLDLTAGTATVSIKPYTEAGKSPASDRLFTRDISLIVFKDNQNIRCGDVAGYLRCQDNGKPFRAILYKLKEGTAAPVKPGKPEAEPKKQPNDKKVQAEAALKEAQTALEAAKTADEKAAAALRQAKAATTVEAAKKAKAAVDVPWVEIDKAVKAANAAYEKSGKTEETAKIKDQVAAYWQNIRAARAEVYALASKLAGAQKETLTPSEPVTPRQPPAALVADESNAFSTGIILIADTTAKTGNGIKTMSFSRPVIVYYGKLAGRSSQEMLGGGAGNFKHQITETRTLVTRRIDFKPGITCERHAGAGAKTTMSDGVLCYVGQLQKASQNQDIPELTAFRVTPYVEKTA